MHLIKGTDVEAGGVLVQGALCRLDHLGSHQDCLLTERPEGHARYPVLSASLRV